ncbi:putative disease resistance protein RGA1 isoform X2 [Silene latifolia]
MADIGTVLSVAQTLFAALECSGLKGVFPVIGYKSDLKDLKKTVKTVDTVLLVVRNKSTLSEIEFVYFKRLKDVLYDAEDLFDRYLSLNELKDGKLSTKVRKFFSSRNSVKVAFSMRRDIKKIRKKLNDIADDHAKFGLSVETHPHTREREETHSFVYEDNVVGRENETNEIIGKLLDSTKDVSFLTIVGVGGLGKTTLAKLVFGDQRIKSEFSLRLWACVSDHDGESLNVKEVVVKMLKSIGCKFDDISNFQHIQMEYQQKLKGNKFLLVLDDVWTEKPLEWGGLRDFLMLAGMGSRIIVTTRSMETASIIEGDIHELEGLSKENSLRLFEMTAFREGSKPPEFVEISKMIVDKCYNVPLAIKVVGSLLRGKPMDKWHEFAISGLTRTFNGMDQITSTLKLSYDQLDPWVKNCFAYCALFPKNYIINKEMLMNLWEAQGYTVPFGDGHCSEDHFSTLLQRCFFQDVNKDEFGDVVSFKMHDLMHDLAQKIFGDEVCVIKSGGLPILDNTIVRHLLDIRDKISEDNFNKSLVRSYLKFEPHYDEGCEFFNIYKMFQNWIHLRALAFNLVKANILPNSMGNLLQLRYLNLANSFRMRKLPDAITDLHNLQTLILSNCRMLTVWPREFSRLVNLTHLYRDNCEMLRCMPTNMHRLMNLRVLTDFVLEDESRSGIHRGGQLKDLKALVVNLKGRLVIHIERTAEGYNGIVGSYLKGSERLKEVHIRFPVPLSHNNGRKDEERKVEEEVMQGFQPHPNLLKFELHDYKGGKIGRWGRAQDDWAALLPNLVCVKLSNCSWLQQLPLLSRLLYLKSLHLCGLEKLEFVEERVPSSRGEITFFPSLESLEIRGFTKLKEWWRGSSSNLHCQPAFPRLSQVTIVGCPGLTSFPACPNIQTLSLQGNNEALRITTRSGVHASSSSSYDENLGLVAESDSVDHLKSLAPRLLTSLYTSNNIKTESLSEVKEVFKYCSSSLRALEIQHYNKLTRLCGGLEHLTALQSLTLEGCNELKFEEEEHNNTSGMPWRLLHCNLRSLKLDRLNKVENLPEGMKYLTSLQHLEIKECKRLNALPEWVNCLQSLQSLHIETCCDLKSLPQGMTELTSLQKLKIFQCPDLKERCQQPSGEDWPIIQHIPRISIP